MDLVDAPTVLRMLYRILLCDDERLRWLINQQPAGESCLPGVLSRRECGYLGRDCNVDVPDWWCRIVTVRGAFSRYVWTPIWHVAGMSPHYCWNDYSRRCDSKGRSEAVHGR